MPNWEIQQKIKRVGRSHVTIGSHRMWTNSEVLRCMIKQEQERRVWRNSRGHRPMQRNSWGKVLTHATKEQLDGRELDHSFLDAGFQIRRIQFSEAEIYVPHRPRRDLMGRSEWQSDNVVSARLVENKQLNSDDVYERVPLTECWKPTGRASVEVK